MSKSKFIRTRITSHTEDALERLLREVNAPRIFKNVKDGHRQIITKGTILNDFLEDSLRDGSLQAYAHRKYLNAVNQTKSA